MKLFLSIPLLTISLIGYGQSTPKTNAMNNNKQAVQEKEISCKLTSPEMRKRKATVIASLKKQVIEKKELENGYSYKFKGSDTIIDELASFVKTERLCCDFFDFSVSVKGDGSNAWLTITGPKGTKDFITSELEM